MDKVISLPNLLQIKKLEKMKKNALLLIGLLMLVCSITLFESCTKDFEDPVEHHISYILINNTSTPSEFFISYSDPNFANDVNYRLDSLMIWSHNFVAKNPYPCLFEVFSAKEGADFSISILQDSTIVETIRANKAIRDTTRAKLFYSIVR